MAHKSPLPGLNPVSGLPELENPRRGHMIRRWSLMDFAAAVVVPAVVIITGGWSWQTGLVGGVLAAVLTGTGVMMWQLGGHTVREALEHHMFMADHRRFMAEITAAGAAFRAMADAAPEDHDRAPQS